MAKDAGDLALTLVPAYYEALLYSHPSFFGVLDRLDSESFRVIRKCPEMFQLLRCRVVPHSRLWSGRDTVGSKVQEFIIMKSHHRKRYTVLADVIAGFRGRC